VGELLARLRAALALKGVLERGAELRLHNAHLVDDRLDLIGRNGHQE
jgi:hypothetical protein